MFELADSSATNPGDIVIFDDELLQEKFNKIRAIFDIKGYPSQRRVNLQYRTLEYSPTEQMKDVPSDESVLTAINETADVLRRRISELNSDEQQQGARINELKADIEKHGENYAVALVKDDSALIQHIEDGIADCEAGIRKATRRKAAISEARATIAQYLEVVQTMGRVLDERNRAKLEDEARSTLKAEIKIFAEKVADYQEMRRTVRPVPYQSDQRILNWIVEGLRLDL